MNTLSDEVLGSILGFLPPRDLLDDQTVSKQMARVLSTKRFWQLLYLEKNPSTTAILSKEQLQRCLVYEDWRRQGRGDSVSAPRFLQEGSLVPNREMASLLQIERRTACLASTTHNVTEHLTNVLPISLTERNVQAPDGRYWSSEPNPDKDSKETLLFSLRYPSAVVSKVIIKPFREPSWFIGHRHVYTWKQTVIRAYRIDSGYLHQQTNARKAIKPQKAISDLIGSVTPVFESQSFDVPSSSSDAISYSIPPGVIANVITVELVGKNFEQYADNGYYACVERVNCIGIPLAGLERD